MLEKLKKRMQEMSDAAQKAAAEALPGQWTVSEDVQKRRWEICSSCVHLYQPTRNCRLCGCFMQVKTALASAKCPINKWTVEKKTVIDEEVLDK
jgi:hypothetical protein